MLNRGCVFIVDTDTDSADMLQELLEGESYAVVRATSGEEALEGITEVEPNLILLDTKLPDDDPFRFLEKLKQNNRTRDIPIIFLTTLDDAEVRLKGLQSGDDLVIKPFDKREILARIERQVTVSKVRMALRESEAKCHANL